MKRRGKTLDDLGVHFKKIVDNFLDKRQIIEYKFNIR